MAGDKSTEELVAEVLLKVASIHLYKYPTMSDTKDFGAEIVFEGGKRYSSVWKLSHADMVVGLADPLAYMIRKAFLEFAAVVGYAEDHREQHPRTGDPKASP